MQFRAIVGNAGVFLQFLSFVLPDTEIIGFGTTAFNGMAYLFADFLEVVTGLTHFAHEFHLFVSPGDSALFKEFVDAHNSSAHIWFTSKIGVHL
jgi:hypothetical protein